MKDLLNDLQLYAGVMRRVGYTLTLGMASSNRRSNLLSLYHLYPKNDQSKDQTPIDPYIIPKTDVFELFGSDDAVYEGVYECGFGHTTEFELKVISNLVKKANPKRVFEIGTFQGRTTLNMALNSSEQTEIITLDLPASELNTTHMEIEDGEVRYVDKDISGERFIGHPASYKIKQVFGDSATFDFETYKQTIDLAFIDGSHAYKYVINDSEKVLKMMRPGGLIIWHDYTNWDGVRAAMNELYRKDERFKNLKHIGGTSILILHL
ncbi:class I SAM-dependent methyltransferase [Dyadobacter sp. LJ53]|uniref:class I SAM-dependent methyltransferase n=1 Tax=Dyadobacter chenwenxiniae TaxID=2906456 RepID=UPI001F2ADFC5|nr:class I SAM-dependent methyltransferase [Dyadobacter chenwenxiniae]MCF0048460.1 class I SAM-dependent methyltransferase [Dyadobacter chenwenxiniae]